MSYGPPAGAAPIENSIIPSQGWHCLHMYYRFDRAQLAACTEAQKTQGRAEIAAALDPAGSDAPQRMQTSIVSGHKADFGVMLMDGDPLKLDRVKQRLAACALGAALTPTYSFVSITEISEYVPSVEQFAKRLLEEGEQEGTPGYTAKVKGYEQRLPMMNKQRLTPDFPNWPAMCFYPMNKKRKVGENWFTLSLEDRSRMMSEHARSGMTFAGKVSQLITVSVGIDDWEWGVTLWARNPEFLTHIVYKMRFDEASARFGEFGPFYTSYVSTAANMLEHCRV